jgi:predicted small secreted protein
VVGAAVGVVVGVVVGAVADDAVALRECSGRRLVLAAAQTALRASCGAVEGVGRTTPNAGRAVEEALSGRGRRAALA